jgi:tight adherence protein B
LGGTELLQILRTLGDFLRQDLALRREIEVKHGWIKNSAHISAAAPWILLLLLSTQPSTAIAYSTTTGGAILIAGLVMTAVAYMWMNRLGRLPQTPRVFTGVHR